LLPADEEHDAEHDERRKYRQSDQCESEPIPAPPLCDGNRTLEQAHKVAVASRRPVRVTGHDRSRYSMSW